MAELKNIAYMLGAKSCSIEISESSWEVETSKKKFSAKTASATMSQKTAYAIDNAISKISVGGNVNMEGQATKENQSKLIFEIEF